MPRSPRRARAVPTSWIGRRDGDVAVCAWPAEYLGHRKPQVLHARIPSLLHR